jgi:hypothetical protein
MFFSWQAEVIWSTVHPALLGCIKSLGNAYNLKCERMGDTTSSHYFNQFIKSLYLVPESL